MTPSDKDGAKLISRLDDKYRVSSPESAIEEFHFNRRMFVFRNGELTIAPERSLDSHAAWFTKMGWISSQDDSLMEHLTRGYVDSTGIFAYTGYDFRDSGNVEAELKLHLKELVLQLTRAADTSVFIGLSRLDSRNWKGCKKLGTVKELLTQHRTDVKMQP